MRRLDLHLSAKVFFLNLPGQDVQTFDVKGYADKVPFAFYCFEASQQEASEPHDRLYDAKYRFRGHLALSVDRFAFFGF